MSEVSALTGGLAGIVIGELLILGYYGIRVAVFHYHSIKPRDISRLTSTIEAELCPVLRERIMGRKGRS